MQQRMWPAADAKAVDLPPAIARRRLLAGSFLEEVMTSAEQSAKDVFTRTAYFNYNAVSRRYEYFSLDSSAPQMMNERSAAMVPSEKPGPNGIKLDGSRFLAAQWGNAANVAFSYRLSVGAIDAGRQPVRLYLTPESPENAEEFLAFEYVYTSRH